MKIKNLLFGLLLFFISFSSNAQTYEQGEILVSPGVSIGLVDRYPGVGFGIPVLINADYFVHEYVSVGAFAGFAFLQHTSDKRFVGVDFGARGSFHFWSFIDDRIDADLRSEVFDVYGVVQVGYSVSNYRKLDGNSGRSNGRFITGPMLGGRWYFTERMAVFAEGGLGSWGLLNGGFTFRF